MSKKSTIIILSILAVIGVVMRLVPHPANFTPLVAIALFSGYYLSRSWGIFLPVMVMLIADVFIGFYDWRLMLVVYGSLALAGLIGYGIRKSKNVLGILTASLGSSIIFFVLTNLAVWLFSSWYSHDLSGLLACYALAVPFFKNTMLGDLFFVGIFFGSFELVRYFVKCNLANHQFTLEKKLH